MANEDDLFDVDFSQLGDGGETIDLAEVNAEPTQEQQGEDVVLETPTETGETQETVINKEEPKEDNSLEIPTINDIKEQVDTEGQGPDSGGESSPVTPFASLLQEKGFLPNLDLDEFKKAEDPFQALTEAWGNEVKVMQEALISSFPPELVDMARAVAQGVPFEALKDSKMQEINYSRITDDVLGENTDLQKRLVYDYLTTKGFNQKKINGLLETYEDSGKLAEEASDALGELKSITKQQQEYAKQQYAQQQQAFQQQHAQRIKHIEDTIKGTEEVIPGMKLTEKARKDLFANMTQVVGQDQQGNPIPYVMALRQEDPLKFDMAVTYLAQTTKGFTDWSKLNKTAKSNAAKQLADTLEAQPARTAGGAKKIAAAEDAEQDLMNSLKGMFNE
jgi:hypothetical protein